MTLGRTNITYADAFPYWKTGKSDPGTWIERAGEEIERAGGQLIGYACGRTGKGNMAHVLQFKLCGDLFRIVWPILTPKREKDALFARRQAATALFHDVKARCITLRFMGARAAFCAFILLPDGRTVGEVTTRAPAELPEILGEQHALPAGNQEV